MTNQIIKSASELNGEDVKNHQGESLGDVKDVMLDTENNSVAYYVLSFGGLFGLGDKYFAIPPEAMKLNTQDSGFILDIDKDRLENAEGFDKDNWPDMADPKFRSNLYQHYGITDNLAV
ncbi:MAG: photosystem reaction center subunit H [Alphaproteobacteria bacterium CG11_big_fil_rev_8_21_14_0_20_39_49]|nr:MAG: photosystem reaction center subunit H [Alphaproteobacteria bacterium CG11_big_fil_rev_8_21_14_0_20_39_49]